MLLFINLKKKIEKMEYRDDFNDLNLVDQFIPLEQLEQCYTDSLLYSFNSSNTSIESHDLLVSDSLIKYVFEKSRLRSDLIQILI